MLDSSSKAIQPKGEDATEFHYASPKDLRVGTYMVTVYADGDWPYRRVLDALAELRRNDPTLSVGSAPIAVVIM